MGIIIPCLISYFAGVAMTIVILGFCISSGNADERAGYKQKEG
ncbi:hypothetical protein [Pectinatus frisingensis]